MTFLEKTTVGGSGVQGTITTRPPGRWVPGQRDWASV